MPSSRVDLLQSLLTGDLGRGGWVTSVDEALAGRQLDRPLPGEEKTQLKDLLAGLAQHQAYYLGQVVLLRELLDKWPPS